MRIICIFLALIFIMACHKDEDISKNDVLLLAKSLDEIKHDISGVWKLQYTTGGDCGCQSPYYCCTYINFWDGNSITVIDSSGMWYNNLPINWFKTFNGYKNILGGNDTIYYMEYAFYRWLPYEIKQDTLWLFDLGKTDGVAYALTHSK